MKTIIHMFMSICIGMVVLSCKTTQNLIHINNKCGLYKQAINTILNEDLMFAKSRKIFIVENLIYIKKFDELLNDYIVSSQNDNLIIENLNTYNIDILNFTQFNNDTLLKCEKEIAIHCNFINYNSVEFDSIWRKSLHTNDLLLISFSNVGYTKSYKHATLFLKSRYSNGNKEYIFFFYEQQMDKTYKLITYYRLRF